MSTFIIFYSKNGAASNYLFNKLNKQKIENYTNLTFTCIDNEEVRKKIKNKIKSVPCLLVTTDGNVDMFTDENMYKVLKRNMPEIFNDIVQNPPRIPISYPQPPMITRPLADDSKDPVVSSVRGSHIEKGDGHETMGRSSLMTINPDMDPERNSPIGLQPGLQTHDEKTSQPEVNSGAITARPSSEIPSRPPMSLAGKSGIQFSDQRESLARVKPEPFKKTKEGFIEIPVLEDVSSPIVDEKSQSIADLSGMADDVPSREDISKRPSKAELQKKTKINEFAASMEEERLRDQEQEERNRKQRI